MADPIKSAAKSRSADTSRGNGNRHRTRVLVLQALYQWQLADTSITDLSRQFLATEDATEADQEYFARLLRGIITESQALTLTFGRWLDRAESQLDPIERAVLLLGSYELVHCPELPYRVAINESVQLAKTFGGTDSHRYINGVLDRVARVVREVEISASA